MYKSLKSQVKDIDSKGLVVVAANAFGNVDVQGDMSMTGSFAKTIQENFNRVKWFLNHDTTLLLGVPVAAQETPQYLEITGQLNMNKEMSRNIFEDYKLYAEYGKTLEHSIGVDAIKWSQEGTIRKVSEWRLWEFSTLTAWGANENTPMLSIKDAKSEMDWLNLRLDKGKYTDEKFLEIEKQIQLLKSLIEEPAIATPTTEPIDWKSLSDTFIQSLKK